MEQIEKKEYILSKIKSENGIKILDLGCGNGDELISIGRRINNADFYGIDKSENGIKKAKNNTCGDDRFHFVVGDVSEGIPFQDDFFDAVYSIDMLECITNKEALLKEIYRVLKPNGQVIMAHYDFDTQLFDGTDKNLVRKIVQTYNDWQQAWMDDCDAWMGRRLWRYMNGSGLFKGNVDVYVMTNTQFEPGRFGYDRVMDFKALVDRNMIKEEDYKTFLNEIRSLSEQNQYFYSINTYIFDGVKL